MEETRTPKALIIAIIVVILVGAGVIVVALNGQEDVTQPGATNQSTTPSDGAQTTDEAAPAPSERMLITYKDSGFEPQSITVKKGTAVTVKNESSHDLQFASSVHPTHRDNPEMNLKTLSPGESDSYTATNPGTWTYHDHLNPTLTGTVTVTE